MPQQHLCRLSAARLYQPALPWLFAVCMFALQQAQAQQAVYSREETASMNTPRHRHTATLLNDGTVLVAGGSLPDFLTTAGAELYDPEHHSWETTAGMNSRRSSHTATLLADGTVLVTGGRANVNDSSEIFVAEDHVNAGAEIYDPTGRSWTEVRPMHTARVGHTATLLTDGTVLVSGGHEGTNVHAGAEIYDPATRSWTPVHPMNTARAGHTATRLADGTVLVSGGYEGTNVHAGAEIYDPATRSWTPVHPMNTARKLHTATLLPNGGVLVAGSYPHDARAEIYDPATRSWTIASPMNSGQFIHTAILLPDGTVLAAGGQNSNGIAGAEIYDPATDRWTTIAPLSDFMLAPTTAILLADGTVLFTGGSDIYTSADAWILRIGMHHMRQSANVELFIALAALFLTAVGYFCYRKTYRK